MKWNIYEHNLTHNCPYLNENDKILYAREQTEGGFLKSETNQLIFNLKKPIQDNGQFYKTKAIQQFALELSSLQFPKNGIFIPDPTSKIKNDINYDNRLIRVLFELKKLNPNIQIEEPIELKNSILSSHTGGFRCPDFISDNYIWKGFSWQNNQNQIDNTKSLTILYIDDMLTSGAHFRAFNDFILQYYPNSNIYGIYWAKRVYIN